MHKVVSSKSLWWVYVLAEKDNPGNYYKVGVTRGPIAKRVADLQTGNARPLICTHRRLLTSKIAAYAMEKTLLIGARKMGAKIRGEWIEAGPHFVGTLVEWLDPHIEPYRITREKLVPHHCQG